MKIAGFPLLALPFIAAAIAGAAWLISALIDQVHLRSAYQVWQENETFAAAAVALMAAMFAARPVYMQVRAQSVQAALDLLRRTEADTAAFVEGRNRLSDLRRAAVALAGEIDTYATRQEPDAASLDDLKDAIGAFLAISPKELKALAERATINDADRTKFAALGAVASIAQRVALGLLAQERDGMIARKAVAEELDFINVKLAGVFTLASEITEDLEDQERAMRERALQLRRTADATFT